MKPRSLAVFIGIIGLLAIALGVGGGGPTGAVTAAAGDTSLIVGQGAGSAAALADYAANVSSPGNAPYHHYLTVGQFASMFGPTASAISAVEASLRAEGLTPGPLSANHLLLPVTATAQFSITVKASAAGKVTVLAVAAAQNCDPRPRNNISTLRIAISHPQGGKAPGPGRHYGRGDWGWPTRKDGR